jgi:hypothetical protein
MPYIVRVSISHYFSSGTNIERPMVTFGEPKYECHTGTEHVGFLKTRVVVVGEIAKTERTFGSY